MPNDARVTKTTARGERRETGDGKKSRIGGMNE